MIYDHWLTTTCDAQRTSCGGGVLHAITLWFKASGDTPRFLGRNSMSGELAKKDNQERRNPRGGIFADGTRPRTALEVLRLLRNRIHDAGLDSIAVQPPTRIQETWIVLP
jgi:hypothetical protein